MYNTPGAPWANYPQPGASLGVNIIRSDDGRGILITRVHAGTPAQQMGLRPGDRITSINGERVRSVDEFILTVRSMNPRDEVDLEIVRDENTRILRGNLAPYASSLARETERREPGLDAQQSTDPFRQRAQLENRQASFEDRGPSNEKDAADVESRLSRVEEKLQRMSQDIAELRNAIGSPRDVLTRDTGGKNLGSRRNTQPRANEAQPNSRILRQNDRWSNENRFDQADIPAARERAAQEAARRRANQIGNRLQQQERQRNSNTQQSPDQSTKEQQPNDTSPMK
jgi:hypothetical protein